MPHNRHLFFKDLNYLKKIKNNFSLIIQKINTDVECTGE